MQPNSAKTILRWGLAFVFFYAAIAGLVSPQNWIGYIPDFAGRIVNPRLLLSIFSVYEFILAALLFSGWKIYWTSLISTATLAAIVLFNFSQLDVVFRDVGLAMASLALFDASKTPRAMSPNTAEGNT